MKKSLLAIAAISAFASAAQAQSSVTVYGILDVAAIGQTNSGNLNSTASTVPAALAGSNATGGSVVKPGSNFGISSNGESMSRLGFKGSEDLGGGTKAIFTLEQGFSPSTGELGNTGLMNQGAASANISGDSSIQGQLFNRGAFVGLSNDKYGTLTAGRQQNLMLDNIGNYDPVVAFAVSPLQYAGSYGGGGRTDMARVDGALKYVWKSNGFNANLLYAPGGVASQSTMNTTTGAQVGWENAKYGVQAIASHTTDAMNLTAANVTTATVVAPVAPATLPTVTLSNINGYQNTVVNTTAYQLTAKWSPVDALWIKGGYERELIGTPSNFQNYNILTTTGGVPLTNRAGQTNYFVNVAWIGAQYQVTPAIKVSAGYYYAGTPTNGTCTSTTNTAFSSYSGGCTGTAQYEALTVDYSLSKRTNLYALLGNTTLTGGQKYIYATSTTGTQTQTLSGQQTYGIGVRHSF